MSKARNPMLAAIPAIEQLQRRPEIVELLPKHGRDMVIDTMREVVDELRTAIIGNSVDMPLGDFSNYLVAKVQKRISELEAPSLRPVFNLTGTVLHTNLGRAQLPREVIDAMVRIASGPSNVEFDLARGKRGDRDSHLERWLCRLTGAEAATVVNNNAAAVLLILNTLALRKEVPVSRGELIEIGGAFRMPDIMARAGCKLVEVGTTNRTHLNDYAGAIGSRTALLMKVHTSNYAIQGFTASVPEKKIIKLAHEHGLPYVNDLGSGTLVDLRQFGLPYEPTPMEAISNGADLVTFSGDKLLGGPQCGVIVGRSDLLKRIKRNPLKRAMRLDKLRMAGLAALIPIYANPERLPERLPTLRLLTRRKSEIEGLARRLAPVMRQCLKGVATVAVIDCESQIGSGALPLETLQSAGLSLHPERHGKNFRVSLKRMSAAFRSLPIPVIGRIQNDALVFDLRCLDDERSFSDQLIHLDFGSRSVRS